MCHVVLFISAFLKDCRAILDSQQNWEEGTEISHTLHPPPNTSPSHHQYPPPERYIYSIDESILTHHNYPKYIVYFIPLFIAIHSEWLEKHMTTCIHNYSIIQSIFTAIKTLVLHLFIPFPRNHRYFYWVHNSVFSRMSYGWNCTVYSLYTLTSFT